jgi:hypothetical protein
MEEADTEIALADPSVKTVEKLAVVTECEQTVTGATSSRLHHTKSKQAQLTPISKV